MYGTWTKALDRCRPPRRRRQVTRDDQYDHGEQSGDRESAPQREEAVVAPFGQEVPSGVDRRGGERKDGGDDHLRRDRARQRASPRMGITVHAGCRGRVTLVRSSLLLELGANRLDEAWRVGASRVRSRRVVVERRRCPGA